MSAFKRQYQSSLSRRAGIHAALMEVTQPIVFNSLSLAAGFLVLLLSSFQPIINLGYLVASTMIICAIFTLFIVPLVMDCIPEKWCQQLFQSNTDNFTQVPQSNVDLNV